MCPLYNSSKKECRVTPQGSNPHRDNSEIQSKCTNSSNYKKCGNYEAYQRSDYKIER